MTDWRAVRALSAATPRAELQAVAKEARHMRLLRRGTQIEARLAEVWREHGAYRQARDLLRAAVVEDQFAATSRPRRGVTVMTIHKAKGKEFDEMIVFEGRISVTSGRAVRRPRGLRDSTFMSPPPAPAPP